MAPKLLLFAGAPPSSSLTPSACTLTGFTPPFTSFFNLSHSSTDSDIHSSSSHAAWRSLPLNRHQIPTGLTPPPLASPSDFFTTTGNSESLLSQFCEHSLAVHGSLPSSQLEETSFITDTSFDTTTSTTNPALPPPGPSHLSDLEDVPPARHITALNPQTVSLNLIAGVISLTPPRIITTRWGTRLSLVEVLLGDDTASGFAVTFWLPADAATNHPVLALRRQDVVLLQNVALHVFRGKVYGQSLRRDLTRVTLLWRRDGTGHYSTRYLAKNGEDMHPQILKTRLVKDWVLKFVGGEDTSSKTMKARNIWDRPPEDTQ